MRDYIFNRISVKWRLISGIAILLFFIVLAGTGGLVGMHKINRSLSDVYEKNITPFEELRDTYDLFAFVLVNTVDRLLSRQLSWEDGIREIDNIRRKLDNHWASIEKIHDRSYLDNNEDWLREVSPMIKDTTTVIGELMEAVKEKNIQQLNDLQDKKLAPLALEYRGMIDSLIKDRFEATKDKYERAQQQYLFSERAFFLTILTAIMAGVGIVVLLLRSIHDPMSSMTIAIKEIMKGNFSRSLDYDRNDEFGVLITGFNQMRVYLSDLVKQIQRSGIQVTSSITEIAATTKEQETTANEHAATTNEIAASSNQIAATSASLLATMKQVNSLTKNTAFATEEGHKGLVNINTIMVKVEDATGSIVD
ncbi:MAG: methyl-accepting chemotaxis protein [Deltaproteobacteria bacterium]